MPIQAGSRFGPYEVLAPLGKGGMGEVYRARDTRLDRTVAIKVLPSHSSHSPEMRQRFDREARAIARLAHPHICALHDVGSQDGVDYLVMEYLEGETLADRLAKGRLPLGHALQYAIEICEALERAHREGIVHRDLKPGNVMLTRSGVRLMDFGLAKIRRNEIGSPLSALATQDPSLTSEGTIVGTVQYMAPEQLEGREADARSDIFALGATLYEMATGRKAFSGASHATLISSIMTSDPAPISAIEPMTPPALDRVVRACLEKAPDNRWQSAADVGKELGWIAEGSSGGTAASEDGRRRARAILPWAVAALAVLLAAATALLSHRATPSAEVMRFTILPPAGQDFLMMAKLSSDGRRISFLLQDQGGKRSIGVRSLDTSTIQRLTGTENARGLFWSPDGLDVGFFSEGKLRRVGANGGAVQTVCESGAAFSGAWSPEGTILFTKEFGAPIVAVPATGGTPRAVTRVDPASGEVAHFHPVFLPDGRHFLFVARNLDAEKTFIMVASLDSKEVRRLFHADSNAVFAEPGYLLFARDNALFAWRFDPRNLQLIGNPAPALEQVSYTTQDNLLAVSVAANRMVFLPSSLRRRLLWVDRKGRELGTLGDVGGYEDVRVSPDGGRAAVTIRDPSHGQNMDVWTLDVVRGTATRITTERSDEFDAAWSPDGERLVYVSDRYGFYDLFERPASGGAEKVLFRTREDKILPMVAPDGAHLLFNVPHGSNFTRVLAALAGSATPFLPTGDSPFSEEHPEISPDGRWTAFDSSESGQREIYVQPLPAGPKRQVSIGGGQMPVWNRNGSELFYVARDGMLMSVALRLAADRVEIGEPQPLFAARLGINGEIQFPRHPYDVTRDGQRFLLIRSAPDAEPEGAVVVTNWPAALRRAS